VGHFWRRWTTRISPGHPQLRLRACRRNEEIRKKPPGNVPGTRELSHGRSTRIYDLRQSWIFASKLKPCSGPTNQCFPSQLPIDHTHFCTTETHPASVMVCLMMAATSSIAIKNAGTFPSSMSYLGLSALVFVGSITSAGL
jgi:hypothetical protein